MQLFMTKLNKKWIRIIIFYLVAVMIKGYFALFYPLWFNKLELPYGLTDIKLTLPGLGPFLGALLVILIFKPKNINTLFGTSRTKSLLMIVVPLLLFTIVGANNSKEMNPHLFGFWLGFNITLYCIFEETGWRGYLQAELRNMKFLPKYLLIGFLWYAWHLTFLQGPFNILNELIIFLILAASSAGIGVAVYYTRSIIVAACFHMIGNILAFSSLFKQNIDLNNRLLIIGISIALWILILAFWGRKEKVSSP